MPCPSWAINNALPILEAELYQFKMDDIHQKLDLVITTLDIDMTDLSVTE
ncbi:hypothetical protein KIPB_015864, partial [Kipferlia bialata]|eukprot:g15864.t1